MTRAILVGVWPRRMPAELAAVYFGESSGLASWRLAELAIASNICIMDLERRQLGRAVANDLCCEIGESAAWVTR